MNKNIRQVARLIKHSLCLSPDDWKFESSEGGVNKYIHKSGVYIKVCRYLRQVSLGIDAYCANGVTLSPLNSPETKYIKAAITDWWNWPESKIIKAVTQKMSG